MTGTTPSLLHRANDGPTSKGASRSGAHATVSGARRWPLPGNPIARLVIGVVTCLWIGGEPRSQPSNADILVFVSGENTQRGGTADTGLEKSEFTPAVDLLYTYTRGRWRVLGEYFLTDGENELERLQLGFDATADTTVWVGRFHQPVSAWNYKYHHGAFLQPSITRPAIEKWEDDGGILPSHSTGALFESGQHNASGDGYRYSAAVGIGPTLSGFKLRPYDIANPDDGHGGLAASLAFSYYPDYVESSNFGAIVGFTDIDVQASFDTGVQAPFSIKQLIVGIQADRKAGPWQVIAAAYHFDNRPDADHAQYGGSFIAGYAQLIRQLGSATDAYLRIEAGHNTKTAGYLSLFPGFIANRVVLGARFDFAKHQALAFEVARVNADMPDYNEARVQWSAVFP
jgi:hypothetical protein